MEVNSCITFNLSLEESVHGLATIYLSSCSIAFLALNLLLNTFGFSFVSISILAFLSIS